MGRTPRLPLGLGRKLGWNPLGPHGGTSIALGAPGPRRERLPTARVDTIPRMLLSEIVPTGLAKLRGMLDARRWGNRTRVQGRRALAGASATTFVTSPRIEHLKVGIILSTEASCFVFVQNRAKRTFLATTDRDSRAPKLVRRRKF